MSAAATASAALADLYQFGVGSGEAPATPLPGTLRGASHAIWEAEEEEDDVVFARGTFFI